jgi:hypothetical protein
MGAEPDAGLVASNPASTTGIVARAAAVSTTPQSWCWARANLAGTIDAGSNPTRRPRVLPTDAGPGRLTARHPPMAPGPPANPAERRAPRHLLFWGTVPSKDRNAQGRVARSWCAAFSEPPFVPGYRGLTFACFHQHERRRGLPVRVGRADTGCHPATQPRLGSRIADWDRSATSACLERSGQGAVRVAHGGRRRQHDRRRGLWASVRPRTVTARSQASWSGCIHAPRAGPQHGGAR